MKRYCTKWFCLVFILITFDQKSNYYYLLSNNQKVKPVCYTGFYSQQMITKSNVTCWHLYGSGITYLLNGNETKRSVIKLSRGVNLHLLNVRRSLPWLTAFIMDVPCLPGYVYHRLVVHIQACVQLKGTSLRPSVLVFQIVLSSLFVYSGATFSRFNSFTKRRIFCPATQFWLPTSFLNTAS